ncbi:hypothetical protein INR49_011741 [Caranx melampygus]|nr:hypothetical protein INR49_011741 [Caranx melampygus]
MDAEEQEEIENRAYLNPASVWLEASGWVLSCHSALDSTAIHPDLVLFEAQLWQAAALTHVQLGMHQVHTVQEREVDRKNEVKEAKVEGRGRGESREAGEELGFLDSKQREEAREARRGALMARERASTLSPILRTVSGVGPTNITPASAQACAKSDRSERKPYPGRRRQGWGHVRMSPMTGGKLVQVFLAQLERSVTEKGAHTIPVTLLYSAPWEDLWLPSLVLGSPDDCEMHGDSTGNFHIIPGERTDGRD